MLKMDDKNYRYHRRSASARTLKRRSRYYTGSADNPFENYAVNRRKERSSFRKTLTLMTIMFFTAIFAILLFANQQEFFQNKLGENSFITKTLNKISTKNSAKDKPEFTLPFGPRKQNILLLGVDSNGADSDLWVGTRTDTIILLNIDPRRIIIHRCLDMNDRALRNVVVGLGGSVNGVPREDHFDITVASEIMAVLCLANDLEDFKKRVGRCWKTYTGISKRKDSKAVFF